MPASVSAPALLSVVHGTWNYEDWRDDAACRAIDTNLFFPIGLNPSAINQTNVAKAVCDSCAVQHCCLEFALRTNQDHGVWGGHTEEERRILRRARRAAARRSAAQRQLQAS